MKAKSALIAAVASVGIANAAQAATLFVNLTGFSSNTGFPTAGTTTSVNIGAGSTITNVAFTGITFEAFGPSYASEFVVGITSGVAPFTNPYWESQVPGSLDAPGITGPVTANFNNPGLYASTEGFATATGNVTVYCYELFNDSSVNPDATVSSGGITITYTAVPAPGALALLGLAGIVGGRRRRSS
jgi:MYXO-CTERM domain-containing protein